MLIVQQVQQQLQSTISQWVVVQHHLHTLWKNNSKLRENIEKLINYTQKELKDKNLGKKCTILYCNITALHFINMTFEKRNK